MFHETHSSIPWYRAQIMKLCALAHIDLAPSGSKGGGLDVAAVQRDVGAMLRCMQTMRKDHGDIPETLEEGDDEENEGPWEGVAKWEAPLQQVSPDRARGSLSLLTPPLRRCTGEPEGFPDDERFQP